MIKAVTFDLDGVYFKGKMEFIINVSEKFSIDKNLFYQFFTDSEFYMRYKRGEISKDEFWDKVIEIFHINSTTEELLKILEEGYVTYPKTVELVKKLRKRGIKTIVCSNNFKERAEILQEKFNFFKDFDFVIFSHEYGMLKPVLINKVVEISGFKPEEILIIDDSKKTTEYAKRKGFQVIYCENPDKIGNKLKKLGMV